MMVFRDVIQIAHWSKLKRIFHRRIGIPILALTSLVAILLISLFDNADTELHRDIIALCLICIIPTMIYIKFIIFRSHFQFTRFMCDAQKMTFISPRRGLNRHTIVYNISYSTIKKVSLNLFGSYDLSFQVDLLDFLRKPMTTIHHLHFPIPLRLIRDKENETLMFQAFDHLNRHYLGRPGVTISYDPSTVYYSARKDVRDVRGGFGKIIFSVSGHREAEYDML